MELFLRQEIRRKTLTDLVFESFKSAYNHEVFKTNQLKLTLLGNGDYLANVPENGVLHKVMESFMGRLQARAVEYKLDSWTELPSDVQLRCETNTARELTL